MCVCVCCVCILYCAVHVWCMHMSMFTHVLGMCCVYEFYVCLCAVCACVVCVWCMLANMWMHVLIMCEQARGGHEVPSSVLHLIASRQSY